MRFDYISFPFYFEECTSIIFSIVVLIIIVGSSELNHLGCIWD